MNYYIKYQKYKQKYINLKNQLGGLILGEGSFGTVITNPRIPMFNEVFADLFIYKNNKYISKNEVSKLFKNKNEYLDEITKINRLIFNNPTCFIDKYFILPINYGKVNYDEVDKYENYYYDSKYLINNESMQIVFKKENPIISDENYTFSLNYRIFISSFLNILNCINKLESEKLFFDDLKFDNIVYDETQMFKFIDYSSIIDLKNENKIEILQKSVICNLSHVYSITNNPIISSILRELVNGIDAELILLRSRIYHDTIINIRALLYYITPEIKTKNITVNVTNIKNENNLFENKLIKFENILSIYDLIYNESYPNRNNILKTIIQKMKSTNFEYLLAKNHLFSLTNLLLEFIYHCKCEVVDSLINLIVSSSTIIIIDSEVYVTSNNINTIISSINSSDIVELEKNKYNDLLVFDSLPAPIIKPQIMNTPTTKLTLKLPQNFGK